MGQILQFGSTYCPTGMIAASGQTLQIAQNTALFSLFGTIYGGDGQTTFGLPDLRAKDANGQPINPGQPGAGMLHCVVEQGYYPPRD
jgi:microcystin-dependent protein